MNLTKQLENELNESMNDIQALPKKGVKKVVEKNLEDHIKKGYKTITGKVLSDKEVEAYNRLTDKINSFLKKGKKAPEELLNGRHNLFYQSGLKESIINEGKVDNEFVDYFNSFYGPEGIYKKANKVKRPYTLEELEKALKMRDKDRKFPFEGDSMDRETLRDRMIDMKLLNPDY